MGAARTLQRKLKVDQSRRAKPGNQRAKPGTPGHRLRGISHHPAPPWMQPRPADDPMTYADLGIDVELHVTKGRRARRA